MPKKLTVNILKSCSSPESFTRGHDLYQSDAVFDTFQKDDLLTGKCEGSSAPFYQIHVQLDEGGIQEASCTCPYDWGGYCKHIIALMLTYMHNPDAFIEQKNINELLEQLDKDDLVHLITKMADKNPDLYSWLQTAIPAVLAKSQPAQQRNKRKTVVSKTAYKRQIQSILHSLQGYRMSEAYLMMGGMVDQLDHVRDTAYDFLEADDAQGALIILTTLLTEVSGSFEQFDDSDGELGGLFSELSLPLVEAILSADLSKTERHNLIIELEPVVEELSAYGIDDLDVILAALNLGWSEEVLDELEDYDYDEAILTEAKLNILERQNRIEEYLKLCLEAGEYRRYILKQIEVGEFEKAKEVAWKTLTLASEALMVAMALRDAGHLLDALRLAEKGLDLDGSKHDLGTWLGPIEEAQGQIDKAIQAYQAAFTSLPSLTLYGILKKLSGMNWGNLKPILMQILQASPHMDVLVDVYLSEEEWDIAISIAKKAGEWNYSLIEKVADAVFPFRPDWVIQASRKQAEGLIAKTQSKYYATAARWLAKMKQAYLASGRKAEWLSYLEGLKSTYSRRPALQAELRKL
ncbi:MAG TPA: SWIM zinc finger family protein [Anaerolineaceae bacterium]|nr:SWIM zinc finger family protein [Anaerolineaceae bacterium]